MAEQSREPTMEEILSSIKKIIADDAGDIPVRGAKTTVRSRIENAVPTAAAHEEAEAVLELTQVEEIQQMDMSGDAVDTMMDDVSASLDDSLLDNTKAESLARSFTALQTLAEPGVAPQIVRSGETSLEGLVRDMLRPMLKDWLDQNLPPIVESMVTREINRITKKG